MIVAALLADTILEHILGGASDAAGSRGAFFAVRDARLADSVVGVVLGLANSAASGVAGDAVVDIAVPAFIVDEEGANGTDTGKRATVVVFSIEADDE